ncbi:Putative undecaprenyl-phosphate N-acetylgalactosaminyl 1-phosphate transferase [Polaribacter huanghezhanensis]|uniref:sugar transferase n=1 Tax=Polaribacter huanghezhanensis TaxID=1354726 RepID=UPI00264A3B0F|nr:sugar transferase [Polaribacter huanghezhanensis]WKD86119.1 Putative undecaprenyl-phosphate N-acetylgalactosaminyl 1-phosphate transferase [Polaribacter huanghezhanensis]
MIKRIFDFTISFISLLILLPILFLVSVIIKFSSSGPVFYKQVRVGRRNKDFKIFKFRTMHIDADKIGLLTIGGRDPRVTYVGYYLRKYKLDELPQLINVFKGDMSFVGPRPEVRQYVNLYSDDQKKVLNVKPGITDLASIEFRDENEILSKQADPNQYYIDIIMPHKLKINLRYIENRNLAKDVGVIIKTCKAILKQ